MPSKLGFGDFRKKSSPVEYGSAKHYKNPIKFEEDTEKEDTTTTEKEDIEDTGDAKKEGLNRKEVDYDGGLTIHGAVI